MHTLKRQGEIVSNLLGNLCVCVVCVGGGEVRARACVLACERAHDGAGPIGGLSIVCGKKTSLFVTAVA